MKSVTVAGKVKGVTGTLDLEKPTPSFKGKVAEIWYALLFLILKESTNKVVLS